MGEILDRAGAGPNGDELAALVGRCLELAKAAGATAAEVGAGSDRGLSVTVRLGEVETIEYHRDKSLGVTVYFGQRKGSASSSDFAPQAVRATVEAACEIARHTAADDYAGLADPGLMASAFPDLDLYHPWPLDADAAIETARRCEAAARDYDQRITNSEGATVGTVSGSSVYGNSHGFMGPRATTRHSLSCSVLAGSGDGMQRDYWYSVARSSADLEPAEDVGRRAAERTLRRLGSRRIPTGAYPVVFSAEMARGLLGHLVAAVRGSALYRQASFLVDGIGRQLFPSEVRVREEPHLRRALGSASFDSEGVATRERDLVADGVLGGYVLDSYAARKLGMQTTGNAGGVHNLTLLPGEHEPQQLLRQMGKGLLVTEMMGMGVNIVTGDFSRGVAGFWVEGGEIQHPVEEITVAGRLQDMFAGLVERGSDLDVRGNIRTPSVLIERMTVASA